VVPPKTLILQPNLGKKITPPPQISTKTILGPKKHLRFHNFEKDQISLELTFMIGSNRLFRFNMACFIKLNMVKINNMKISLLNLAKEGYMQLSLVKLG
jgi:hypothetical protein